MANAAPEARRRRYTLSSGTMHGSRRGPLAARRHDTGETGNAHCPISRRRCCAGMMTEQTHLCPSARSDHALPRMGKRGHAAADARGSAALPYLRTFHGRRCPAVAGPLPPATAGAAWHKLWEGLGYYSRVRNLQKAAQIVMEQHGGALPADYDALLKLPGVGAYTAGAIASISFGLPVPAVDGNVLRVFARILNDGRDVTRPDVKKDLTACVMELQPPERPGDYNQALMELGALACLPGGAPLCSECPLRGLCAARALGVQETLPVKAPPAAKRTQHWTVALVLDMENRRVLLQQRPQKGLLAGLWQPVLLEGARSAIQTEQALAALGVTARAVEPLTPARHVFSHLVWEMDGFACAAQSCAPPPGCVWAGRAEVDGVYTLPGAFKAYRPVLKKYL